MAESFPLDWPLGYKRTAKRIPSNFKQSQPDKVQAMLHRELSLLKAKEVIISTNAPLRRDGRVFSEYLMKRVEDPGVAVYFKYEGEDVVMCCDQYEYPIENMYALVKGVEAIRGMNRWGVSEFIKRAFTGFKALPETSEALAKKEWHEVLGVWQSSSIDQIKSAYRNLVKIHHPDAGAESAAMFNLITKAYNEAMAAKKPTYE